MKVPANKNTDPVRSTDLLVPNPKLRLREQLREVMRFKHYSIVIICENVLPAITTIHHMVNRSRILHAKLSSHRCRTLFSPQKYVNTIN